MAVEVWLSTLKGSIAAKRALDYFRQALVVGHDYLGCYDESNITKSSQFALVVFALSQAPKIYLDFQSLKMLLLLIHFYCRLSAMSRLSLITLLSRFHRQLHPFIQFSQGCSDLLMHPMNQGFDKRLKNPRFHSDELKPTYCCDRFESWFDLGWALFALPCLANVEEKTLSAGLRLVGRVCGVQR